MVVSYAVGDLVIFSLYRIEINLNTQKIVSNQSILDLLRHSFLLSEIMFHILFLL